MSAKRAQEKKRLAEKLIRVCTPEKMNKAGGYTEAKYIDITDKIATRIGGWDTLGISYGDCIELSGEAIDRNCENAARLDLNTCIATLICVHREQHFAWSDVIRPRLESGMLLKLAKRLNELMSQECDEISDAGMMLRSKLE